MNESVVRSRSRDLVPPKFRGRGDLLGSVLAPIAPLYLTPPFLRDFKYQPQGRSLLKFVPWGWYLKPVSLQVTVSHLTELCASQQFKWRELALRRGRARSKPRAPGSDLCFSITVGCLLGDISSQNASSVILHTLGLKARTSFSLKRKKFKKAKQWQYISQTLHH